MTDNLSDDNDLWHDINTYSNIDLCADSCRNVNQCEAFEYNSDNNNCRLKQTGNYEEGGAQNPNW